MRLVKYLANLGYGSRREVARLVADGRVTRAGGAVLSDGDTAEHDDIRVDDEPLDAPQGSVVMLHKPVGYVCSTSDVPPLVYELLPPRFVHRSPVMATIGRLDRDTSGLLLLTDDGAINHRLTSPKSHVAKVYDVSLAEPLRGDEQVLFASGTLQLDGERTPLAPAELEALSERAARVTLHEGRYHQVRRMFAATGNHVLQLHRSRFGPLALGSLLPGAWRVLDDAERTTLLNASRRAP